MEFDLERFHAGDEALFAELVRIHSPRLLPPLRRYAGVDADAHDLLQETWLRVYASRRTFEGRGSFLGWLFVVARSVGAAAVRKRMRRPTSDELSDVAVHDDPDAGPLRDSLREAVLALPERQREVVLLRLVEGMSTAETARLLGCAEGTVKATLHHATRRLRELLKERVR
ncbi:MAG TPA: RNA polymerase sigma factor [Gemmatimonadaceae bacterium]|nr:RNA polymerase sigma factor [Gemmatimonadaceae bacterium]